MRKVNILLFFILITLGSYAQDTLRFVRTQYLKGGLDTTTNHSFSITDTVYSVGPNTIYGPTTFNVKVNSVIVDSTFFVSSNTLQPFDSINPGSTKILTFTINKDTTPPFIIGPNVIVIWPVYHINGTPGYVGPNDSIIINADYYPLGLKEAPLAKMFIFQVPGHLNINFGDAENIVQQVRIYNIIGQGVYADTPEKSKNIPTAAWSGGIYLCEIITHEGEKRTFKFKLE